MLPASTDVDFFGVLVAGVLDVSVSVFLVRVCLLPSESMSVSVGRKKYFSNM